LENTEGYINLDVYEVQLCSPKHQTVPWRKIHTKNLYRPFKSRSNIQAILGRASSMWINASGVDVENYLQALAFFSFPVALSICTNTTRPF
jgi:hypothetical protein